jgi:ABC-type phosphate transport system ATPase subunit
MKSEVLQPDRVVKELAKAELIGMLAERLHQRRPELSAGQIARFLAGIAIRPPRDTGGLVSKKPN